MAFPLSRGYRLLRGPSRTDRQTATHTATKTDPPLRRDGKCAHCKQPRPHARPNKYSGDTATKDPFCSSSCCRAWHQITYGPTEHHNYAA